MTGFVLVLWIFISCCIQILRRSEIDALKKEVAELKRERRIILADDIEYLHFASISLPEGTCAIDENGVREIKSLPVLIYKPKNQSRA